jgi:hypothetical protein
MIPLAEGAIMDEQVPCPDPRARFSVRIQFPECLKSDITSIGDRFPDGVAGVDDSMSIEFKQPLTSDEKIAVVFLDLVSETDDVMRNLGIVVDDLRALVVQPPPNPSQGERRYVLLTRLFFYELLRCRDSFGRFTKGLQRNGLITKEEQRSCRKTLERALDTPYLLRNVYLHGHTIPRSNQEEALHLIACLHDAGYELPVLTPRNGERARIYPDELQRVAAQKADAFTRIAGSVSEFLHNFVHSTASEVAKQRAL